MNIVMLVIQVILAIPQILQLVREIINLIKSHPSKTMQGVYMANLKQLVSMYARDGSNPSILQALHDLRDQVRDSISKE